MSRKGYIDPILAAFTELCGGWPLPSWGVIQLGIGGGEGSVIKRLWTGLTRLSTADQTRAGETFTFWALWAKIALEVHQVYHGLAGDRIEGHLADAVPLADHPLARKTVPGHHVADIQTTKLVRAKAGVDGKGDLHSTLIP